MKLFQRLKFFFQLFKFAIQLSFRKSKNGNNKSIFIYLTDPRCGQYMFTLLAFFLIEGYTIYLYPHLKFLASIERYKSKLFQFKNLYIRFTPLVNTKLHLTSFYHKIIDKPEKHLRLSYDYFAPPSNSIIMPYPMNPNQYNPHLTGFLKNQRDNARTIGVYFSGNQNRDAYNNPAIYNLFKKVNRIELLDHIIKWMPKDKIYTINSELHYDGSLLDKFVLVDWKWSQGKSENIKARIDDSQWLLKLSNCNFFLACPGMFMPMCHNVIEAMSVGAIPITQYADEFYPPLQHGVNCIEFDSKEDAVKKILYALSLPEQEIAAIRKRVIEYYEKHLSPQSFVTSVEKSTNATAVTMNVEQLSILNL